MSERYVHALHLLLKPDEFSKNNEQAKFQNNNKIKYTDFLVNLDQYEIISPVIKKQQIREVFFINLVIFLANGESFKIIFNCTVSKFRN